MPSGFCSTERLAHRPPRTTPGADSGGGCPARLFHFQHFCRFFTELADDADGDFLAFLYREWMALVAVDAIERFVVNFHFQCLLGPFFCGGFGDVAQAAFPIVELVFVATTEENLADDEV